MDSLQKAREAQAMIASPLFVEARKHLEAQLAYRRRDVPLSDSAMHTRLILMEQLSESFFGFFEQLAQTGRMEELRMIEEQKRKNLLEQGLAMFRMRGRGTM